MNKYKLIENIARGLGNSDHAILKWRQRQVPHKLRHEIRQIAAESGVTFDEEDFVYKKDEAANS